MHNSKLVWPFIGLVTIIYLATLLFVRLENPLHLQHQCYTRWRSAYVVKQGKDKAFVNSSNKQKQPVALSEAQGYGLQITALAGRKGWASQSDFDRLLNYYLAHQDYVGSRKTALMQWRQAKNAKNKWTSNVNSATDGDLYIAEALGEAAKVWPRRAAYYHQLQRALLRDILAYEYNPKTHALTVGDWATKKSKYYTLMRTSDVMPTAFDEFYQVSHDQRWHLIKKQMLARLSDLSKQHRTGLVPDFAWISETSARPVKPKTIASKNDGNYSANACRVPMMLASSKDPKARQTLDKMMKVFSNQYYVTAGYTLSGQRLNHYQSASFSAPLFYAASCHRNQGYDNLFFSQKIVFSKHLPRDNYYDATLTTLAALKGLHSPLADKHLHFVGIRKYN